VSNFLSELSLATYVAVEVWLRLAASGVEERRERFERGQGMVEYGLILALIAVVAIVAVSLLGGKINNTFSNINANIG
jgi:pilus assembly protein Flp/PilA